MAMYGNTEGCHKIISVERLVGEVDTYDITVPIMENFAVDLGDDDCVFVHNCRSVHAEQNAIISASRRDMIGGTIYIVGRDMKTGAYADPHPCKLCRRFIVNAGITRCVGLVNGQPEEISLEASLYEPKLPETKQ